LHTLRCSFTQAHDLSPLAALKRLHTLGCSSTQVHDLSPLAALEQLHTLDCSFTQVHDLSPLAALKQLHTLNCFSTQVADLCPLAALVQLNALYCSHTELHALPLELVNNPALEVLIAFNTQIPGLPHGVLSNHPLENCLHRLRAHFADMEAGAENLQAVKLLLLGNGGAGKTQIARWLTGDGFDAHWDSTHGIRIHTAPKPGSIADRLKLQVWDFGGQDIYHGTHTLFLRGPAILMPVWAEDRENSEHYELDGLSFRNHPLAYWCQLALQQGHTASPMLVVQTKCDTVAQERQNFPLAADALPAERYCAKVHFSIPGGTGFAALEERLRKAITWMQADDRLGLPKIGTGRLRVQRQLEAWRAADAALPSAQRRHRLLTQDQFEALCAEQGGVSSPAALLHYLDANGTLIYRPGLFAGGIILDQSWALDALYTLFNRKTVYPLLVQLRGRFTRPLLARLAWGDHAVDEQKLFLSLMLSCGMCFPHQRGANVNDDSVEYIAPDLLPAFEPELADRWDDDLPTQQAQFRYPLLHSGLMRAVMAAIGTKAGVNALYWRTGLYAYDATRQSRLRIDVEMTGPWSGALTVRTQKGDAAGLLAAITALVKRTQTQQGLKPDEAPQPTAPSPQPAAAAPVYGQEKPLAPEWYVSYAWNDTKPGGPEREAIVDRWQQAMADKDMKIIRDKDALTVGDNIKRFMMRLGSADKIFVFLSEKYLCSANCMFELWEVWRNCKQDPDSFAQHVVLYPLPDAKIREMHDRVDHAIKWKERFSALDEKGRANGALVLGKSGFSQLQLMQHFYTDVTDMLSALVEHVQPRNFDELTEYSLSLIPRTPVQ
jgi:internalin A